MNLSILLLFSIFILKIFSCIHLFPSLAVLRSVCAALIQGSDGTSGIKMTSGARADGTVFFGSERRGARQLRDVSEKQRLLFMENFDKFYHSMRNILLEEHFTHINQTCV